MIFLQLLEAMFDLEQKSLFYHLKLLKVLI